MIKKVLQFLKSIFNIDQVILANNVRFDEMQINIGVILSRMNEDRVITNLKDVEFKVFSQSGEDGIIQYLTKIIEIENKTFIELGVQDFFESNCRFLLMKDDWKGFVCDGSEINIQRLKSSYFYWKYQLDAVAKFITEDNINAILEMSNFNKKVGILSIDLDGNDYYVFKAIEDYKPSILILEYNPYFGNTRKISIPYSPKFERNKAHFSNLYWGSSIRAMTYLANKKGYSLIDVGSTGSNAFYVRNDLLNQKVRSLMRPDAFNYCNARESRDKKGNLSYIGGEKRLDIIKLMPVFEVEKECNELL